MQVLTWNLHNGRASSLWPTLRRSLGIDICFLQETHRLEDNEQVLWEPVPSEPSSRTPWGSAVVVSRGTLSRVNIEDYAGWVVGGEWLGAVDAVSRRIFVFSLHSPTGTKSKPRRHYVEEVDAICDAIRRVLPENADLLLAGDFNFASLGKRTGDETIDGKPFKTTPAETRVLNKIESLGVKSCWLTLHPNEPLRQTLRWGSNKTTPYHCDGIFAPLKWLDASICEVLSAPWLKSDHNPVAAWLSPIQ